MAAEQDGEGTNPIKEVVYTYFPFRGHSHVRALQGHAQEICRQDQACESSATVAHMTEDHVPAMYLCVKPMFTQLSSWHEPHALPRKQGLLSCVASSQHDICQKLIRQSCRRTGWTLGCLALYPPTLQCGARSLVLFRLAGGFRSVMWYQYVLILGQSCLS